MKPISIFIAMMALFLNVQPASAQITEIRIGLSDFDSDVIDLGISAVNGRENSVAINGEIIFAEPEFLKWALTPQPYINATVNLEGNTSYGGAGLLWRQSFGDKFYGDIIFGLVIHTGEQIVDPNNELGFFEQIEARNENISFGSRILFREQITFGYRITEDWAAEIFGEHLSNGQIFGRVNEGVDIVGAKLSKRF